MWSTVTERRSTSFEVELEADRGDDTGWAFCITSRTNRKVRILIADSLSRFPRIRLSDPLNEVREERHERHVGRQAAVRVTCGPLRNKFPLSGSSVTGE